MKLARFTADSQILAGRLEEGKLMTAAGVAYDPEQVTWLPPIAGSPKAIGLALNYADHAAELEIALPEAPVLFVKMPSTFIGHRSKIIAPRNIEYMHYECELVVVIGQRCRRVKAAEAYEVVKGYTIGNDVTIRDFVTNFYRPPVKAKGFDTFGPLGPYLVTRDEIPDPANLTLRTYVNDELRQEGHTRNLIHSIPVLIEYITEFMTLDENDMLWTGTPKGVSHIYPGDHLRLEIEGIGVLENEVSGEA